jgi:hypothetical protein
MASQSPTLEPVIGVVNAVIALRLNPGFREVIERVKIAGG